MRSSSSELVEKREITLQKIELLELIQCHPCDPMKNSVLDLALECQDSIEAQGNRGPVWICMLMLMNQSSFEHLNAQLFTKLAAQGVFIALPCFDLAARKLPLERVSGVLTALTDEQLLVPIDQTSNDVNHFKISERSNEDIRGARRKNARLRYGEAASASLMVSGRLAALWCDLRLVNRAVFPGSVLFRAFFSSWAGKQSRADFSVRLDR